MGRPRRMLMCIVLVILTLAAIGPWLAFWSYRAKLHLPAGADKALVDLAGILDAAWIQAYIAWITFVVIAIASAQIYLLYQQNEIQREQAERAAYLPLISPEMISAKRLLKSNEIRRLLYELKMTLDSDRENPPEALRELLDATRDQINEIGRAMSWPLLVGTFASFDHVEMLINLYNFLSMLLNSGKLRREFATELAIANFINVYDDASELIRLRQLLSKNKYAIHFKDFYEKERDRTK